jgi:hypothetical protein
MNVDARQRAVIFEGPTAGEQVIAEDGGIRGAQFVGDLYEKGAGKTVLRH